MAGDWKFEDSPEVGVYKTRQVMAGEEPLGIVSHDLDGDWQFLHYEEVEDGDLRDAAHLMLVHLTTTLTASLRLRISLTSRLDGSRGVNLRTIRGCESLAPRTGRLTRRRDADLAECARMYSDA